MNTLHEIGVSRQIGVYSDAVEVGTNHRWLFTAGTPGLAADGAIADDIAGQSEQVWDKLLRMLERAGMSVRDIVKVTTYLLSDGDIPAYAKVRARVLDGHKPAFMLAVIPHLIRPGMLVEVELVAAKAG